VIAPDDSLIRSTSFVCNQEALAVDHSMQTLSIPPYPTVFQRAYYLHLPAGFTFTVGQSWAGDSYTNTRRGGGMSSLRVSGAMTFTVVGTEPVIVDGQVYDAIQLDLTHMQVETGCAYNPVCTSDDFFETEELVAKQRLTLARGLGVVAVDDLRLVETNVR
jgi:hypothetical protein